MSAIIASAGAITATQTAFELLKRKRLICPID